MKNIVTFSDKQKIIDEAAWWLLKLESEEGISELDKKQLWAWLDQAPAHRAHFQRLTKIWDKANILTELAVPLPQTASPPKKRLFTWTNPSFMAMAASIMLAVGVVGAYLIYGNSQIQQNGIFATQIGKQESINLADGSILKLNTNTMVRVDYSDEYRNIFLLNGEAHFIVAKNKDRPFRVYAGTGRIHAIGTAFSVYLNQGQVDVTVAEGRVGVATVTKEPEANLKQVPNSVADVPVKSLGMLRAGEVGSIVSQLDQDSNPIQILEFDHEITDIDVAKRVSWTKGVLIFAGEPLEEVVQEIGRYTDVAIEFSDPELKKIRIGGNFPVGETEAMFSSLETNFGLQVTRLTSDRVVISSTKRF